MKANEIQHAKYKVIHTESRLNHTCSRVLNRLFMFNIALNVQQVLIF